MCFYFAKEATEKVWPFYDQPPLAIAVAFGMWEATTQVL